ncbi:unnamed protein product, partial [Mesorhabditis belari]|uniref:Uncharacterized protein n=1 Tax=Mesorhabditis belari TaxID=2138241 RepID=A0AAF3F8D8_9BILA
MSCLEEIYLKLCGQPVPSLKSRCRTFETRYPRIDPIEEEEKKVRKYVYVGTAVEDSNKDLETGK